MSIFKSIEHAVFGKKKHHKKRTKKHAHKHVARKKNGQFKKRSR